MESLAGYTRPCNAENLPHMGWVLLFLRSKEQTKPCSEEMPVPKGEQDILTGGIALHSSPN